MIAKGKSAIDGWNPGRIEPPRGRVPERIEELNRQDAKSAKDGESKTREDGRIDFG
jgi:hypothetical protein